MNEMTVIDAPASTSLATIETLVPGKVFAPGGIKSIVSALKAEVRTQAAALDISTEKGRKAIASLAYRVAQSKTALDKMGKDLTAEWQRQTNLVNEDRRYLRDDLDALKDEVRKPLDEYQEAETARVAAHDAALAEIEALAAVDGLSSDEINARIWSVPSIDGRPWQEFKVRAERVIAITLERLQGTHAAAVQREEAAAKAEAERQAEIERQRLEAIEAQRIREEQIATEAAERAQREAEAKAARVAAERAAVVQREREASERAIQAERETAARREQEAAEALAAAAERERLAQEAAVRANERRIAEHRAAIESLRRLAMPMEPPDPLPVIDAKIRQLADVFDNRHWEEFADEAEVVCRASGSILALARDEAIALAERQEAAEAERQRQAAAIQAQRDAQEAKRREEEAAAAATLAEQKRVAAQQAAERAAAEKREQNAAHRRKVEKVALSALMAAGLSEGAAKTAIEAIAKGSVPRMSIDYGSAA